MAGPDFGVNDDIDSITKRNFTGVATAIKNVLRKVGRSDLTRLGDVALQAVPSTIGPGFMTDYAGSTPPDGWLECNGQAVSRTTYAALFAELGVTWGSGDGSTTFNVPDKRGAAAVGMGGTRENGPLAATGSGIDTDGDQIPIAALPEHDHDAGDYKTDVDDGHDHSVSVTGPGSGQYDGGGADGPTGEEDPHDHPLTGDTGDAGGTDDFPVRQPSVHMMSIIRT